MSLRQFLDLISPRHGRATAEPCHEPFLSAPRRPRTSCCPITERRGSRGLAMIEVEELAAARATGDLAIGPVVIHRTDAPDELATDALVKPLGHVVLHKFFDQVAQMSRRDCSLGFVLGSSRSSRLPLRVSR